jgi:hypothetical protein
MRIAQALLLMLLILVLGGGVIASVIDRPLVVDCGGLETDVCEDLWRGYWPSTGFFEAQPGVEHFLPGLVWSPVTYFRFEPHAPGSTCGRQTIERRTFSFGLLGMTADPLCGS